jgi:Transposase IS200 like
MVLSIWREARCCALHSRGQAISCGWRQSTNGEDGHVHFVAVYPPNVVVASVVDSLKGATSRVVRKAEFPEGAAANLGWPSGERTST